jgi:hypothetical protein
VFADPLIIVSSEVACPEATDPHLGVEVGVHQAGGHQVLDQGPLGRQQWRG